MDLAASMPPFFPRLLPDWNKQTRDPAV